jgi:hypothetical protein
MDVVIALLAAVIVMIAVRLTRNGQFRFDPVATARRFADGGRGHLAPLIAALYRSLLDPATQLWHGRGFVVTEPDLFIVANGEDASLLEPKMPAIESDLNGALKTRASRDRLSIPLPIAIRGVIVHDDVPAGEPRLVTRGESAAWFASEAPEGAAGPADKPDTPAAGPAESVAAAAGAAHPAARMQTEPLTTTLESPSIAPNDRIGVLWPLGAAAQGLGPVAVPKSGCVLGRDPRLGPGHIDAATVSWQHADIRPGEDGWTIRDLGATNGLYVDGRRVTAAKVHHGDVIGLGQTLELRFVSSRSPFQPTQELDDSDPR